MSGSSGISLFDDKSKDDESSHRDPVIVPPMENRAGDSDAAPARKTDSHRRRQESWKPPPRCMHKQVFFDFRFAVLENRPTRSVSGQSFFNFLREDNL